MKNKNYTIIIYVTNPYMSILLCMQQLNATGAASIQYI